MNSLFTLWHEMMPLLPPMHLVWLVLASFVAAYVRSFSGFGFALLAVPAFMLVLPPEQAIPLSLTMDLLVGLVLFPHNLSTGVAWKSVRLLLLSCIPLLPVGLAFSKHLPIPVLQGLIGGLILISTLFLAKGYRSARDPGLLLTLTAGALSGFLGGIGGLFGPPVILLYFSSPMGREISRASMMAYFLVSIFIGLILQISSAASFGWLAMLPILLPIGLLATYLGNRKFMKTDEQTFRRAVFGLLFLLALSLIVKAAGTLA